MAVLGSLLVISKAWTVTETNARRISLCHKVPILSLKKLPESTEPELTGLGIHKVSENWVMPNVHSGGFVEVKELDPVDCQRFCSQKEKWQFFEYDFYIHVLLPVEDASECEFAGGPDTFISLEACKSKGCYIDILFENLSIYRMVKRFCLAGLLQFRLRRWGFNVDST